MRKIKGVRIVLPRISYNLILFSKKFQLSPSCQSLFPKSLSATTEQRKRKSLAKRFQTSERFLEREKKVREVERKRQTSDSSFETVCRRMQIVVPGGALSFYLSRKENAPLLRLTFIENIIVPPLNRITVLNSVRKYPVK